MDEIRTLLQAILRAWYICVADHSREVWGEWMGARFVLLDRYGEERFNRWMDAIKSTLKDIESEAAEIDKAEGRHWE
jgi:hypothetical protein